MIENELLLLGLLRDGPKHGYQIKRKIQGIVSLFAGIDLKSIYYPLRIMEKNGLVRKSANKSGKRPQRFTYRLTSPGELRFDDLMVKSLLDFKRPQFTLDLSLYFLHYVKPQVAKRRLKARVFVLKRLSRALRQMMESFKKTKGSSLGFIVEHNLKMVETEADFLAEFMKSFNKQKGDADDHAVFGSI